MVPKIRTNQNSSAIAESSVWSQYNGMSGLMAVTASRTLCVIDIGGPAVRAEMYANVVRACANGWKMIGPVGSSWSPVKTSPEMPTMVSHGFLLFDWPILIRRPIGSAFLKNF